MTTADPSPLLPPSSPVFGLANPEPPGGKGCGLRLHPPPSAAPASTHASHRPCLGADFISEGPSANLTVWLAIGPRTRTRAAALRAASRGERGSRRPSRRIGVRSSECQFATPRHPNVQGARRTLRATRGASVHHEAPQRCIARDESWAVFAEACPSYGEAGAKGFVTRALCGTDIATLDERHFTRDEDRRALCNPRGSEGAPCRHCGESHFTRDAKYAKVGDRYARRGQP